MFQEGKVVKRIRLCQRCGKWRSAGNFSHWVDRAGVPHVTHVCHRCAPHNAPHLRAGRFWWPVKEVQ